MNELVNFIYSDNFIVFIILTCFSLGILGLIDGVLIGRHKFIQKMDMVFQGYSIDFGIPFNLLRASSYGMAMLFPNTIVKRLFKDVDYTLIDRKTKSLYIFYPLSLFLSAVFMGIGVFLIDTQ